MKSKAGNNNYIFYKVMSIATLLYWSEDWTITTNRSRIQSNEVIEE